MLSPTQAACFYNTALHCTSYAVPDPRVPHWTRIPLRRPRSSFSVLHVHA